MRFSRRYALFWPAEDTQSTYDDGEVLGSLIGNIDWKPWKMNFTKKLSDTHKFEGLTCTQILQKKKYNFYLWRQRHRTSNYLPINIK
jgi:hypothetical protein